MSYSVIIQDRDNKLFQRLQYLTGDQEEKVTSNIATIQPLRKMLNMHSIDHDSDVAYLTSKGWVESNSLYDQLILEHNNQPGNTNFLRAF